MLIPVPCLGELCQNFEIQCNFSQKHSLAESENYANKDKSSKRSTVIDVGRILPDTYRETTSLLAMNTDLTDTTLPAVHPKKLLTSNANPLTNLHRRNGQMFEAKAN